MSATNAAIDPARCPICGQPNRCAMEIARETGVARPPCWCMDASFTPGLLAAVPGHARRVACICSSCSAKALANKEHLP